MSPNKTDLSAASLEQSPVLQAALASIGDAVVVTDANGQIDFLNAAAEAITGWAAADARGQALSRVFRIVNERTRAPVENPVEKVLRSGLIQGLANHTVLLTKDGREIPIDDSAAPIKSQDGAVIGVVLVFRDITERRRSELRAAWLASIVESSDDPIISKSIDGRITSWNQAAERLLGYRETEIVGKPITTIIPSELQDEEKQILERLRRGEPVEHFDTVRLTKDGRPVHVTLKISPLKNSEGEVVGASKVMRDVRRRKELEMALASIGDAVIVTDETGKVDYLNAVAEGLTAWSAIEAKGQPLVRVFHIVNERSRAPAENPVEKVLQSGHVQGLANHTVLLARDGREIPIDDSAAPVRAPGGQVVGVVLVFRDITERRAFELRAALLASIVESSEDAIITKTLDGRITSWNRAAERLLGYTEAEIVGKSILTIIPPELQDEEPQILAHLRRGERIEHFETTRLTKQGKRIDLSLTISPLRNSEGEVVGASKIARDITARKAAEERQREEKLVQAVLAKVNQSLVAAQLDLERVVQLVTDATTELSGAAFGAFFYNVQDERGESYTVYTLSGAPRAAFERFPHPRNTAVFGPTFRGEGIVRSADITADPRYGKNSPYHGMPEGHLPVRSYLAVPVKTASGQVLGGLFFGHPEPGVFSERSERLVLAVAKQAGIAFESARLHQAAEQEIERRKKAEKALSEADRRKDEFLAMLAHELRNPMAPIGNASEVLARMLPEDSPAQPVIGIIKRQAVHLTHLVDDLLDVSRVTQGHIQLSREPVDLATVITQAVETVESQLREKGHHLTVATSTRDEPLYVEGDFARLVQCVGNILTNATKYTAPGGEISIRTGGDEHSTFIEVSDNGVGIPPELLPHVFDLFVQSEQTLDRSQGGLGIGLAVVRRLVQQHKGEVTARSEGVGSGSTFEIRLPRIPRPSPATANMACFDSEPRRVLIVDDNADAADSLAMLLRFHNHQTHVVYGAKEALAAIEPFMPDVALIDIGLPQMNGYELAQRLRAMPKLSGVRLIAITGYGQSEDKRQVRAAGFDAHLVKPVNLMEVEHAFVAKAGDS